MYAVVVWWDLAGSAQTIDSLHRRLPRQDRIGAGTDIPRHLVSWIHDRPGNRWGAVLMSESPDVVHWTVLLAATELIGYPPTDRWSFELTPGTDEGTGRPTDLMLVLLGRAVNPTAGADRPTSGSSGPSAAQLMADWPPAPYRAVEEAVPAAA
ncbi:hypothetical protein O7623_03705 [Solwaraspora sp. WMMD791]|uniref:hypothetical protein n=1 Tax=Solwaraspora sp. WMMD791 TaxID=3016086 RepID=UPI00249A7508|nr:hypothetical protein [Solwaraspora sp. WMMD791]WFE28328.1 hypothetical protein O7623_03705 [Solwaraspora sp. WMMD791]